MGRFQRSSFFAMKNVLVKGIYLLTITSMLFSSLVLTPTSVYAASSQTKDVSTREEKAIKIIHQQEEATPTSETPVIPSSIPTSTPSTEEPLPPTDEPIQPTEEPTIPAEPTLTVTPEISSTPSLDPTITEDISSATPEFTPTSTPTETQTTTPALVDLLPLSNYYHKVVSGADFNCFINSAGGLKCMGNNEFGQLGNGTFESSNIPVDVIGLSSNVVSVSAGNGHTACALTDSGAVKCWGDNSNNIFNNGKAQDRSNIAIDVPGFSSGVQSIELGTGHACIINENNGLFCWGNNSFGQLGLGSFGEGDVESDVYSASEVTSLNSSVQDVSLGVGFTCAVVAGGVKCWGANSTGQLGNNESGDGLYATTPVDVIGLAGTAISINAGDLSACAVLDEGVSQCWGAGSSGQLGNGEVNNYSTPQSVKDASGNEVTDIRTISSGSLSSCLINNEDILQCWGDNSSGILGEGVLGILSSPTVITNLTNAVKDVSNRSSICVSLVDDQIQCWGSNEFGQLGIGTTGGFFSTPQDVLMNGEFPDPTGTPEVSPTVVSTVTPDGTILHEWWDDIEGSSVAALTGNPKYLETPSGSELLTRFEGPINYGDNYGARYRGYIYPPVDGDYIFWVNSDDESELSLSTNEDPINKAKIVELNGQIGWSVPSSGIHLDPGQRYYIESLHKEAGGDDYISVYWQIPGQSEKVVIDGAYLSPYQDSTDPDTTDPTKSTIFTSHAFVQANDTQKATITVTLNGSELNPIVGHEVELIQSGTNVTIESTTPISDSDGRVQFTISCVSPQSVTFQARDKTSGVTLSTSVQVVFTSYAFGSILREWWDGIEGTSVSDLTGSPDYLESPTGSELLSRFEGPTNAGDNYGARYQGFIHPPVSGNYLFWTNSDDESEISLSTDENPLNKQKIVESDGWIGWSDSSDEIYLEAGKKYYIEALHKEGTNNDFFEVYWQIPGQTEQEVIDGSYLLPYQDSTDSSKSTLQTSLSRVIANNTQKATITVTLLGAFSYPVVGHEVELIQNGSDVNIESSTAISNVNGQVQFTLSSGVAQEIIIQARDITSNVLLNSNISIEFYSVNTGSILREWWNDIDGISVADLTGNPKYLLPPSGREYLTSFEGPSNIGEYYGARYRGYIYPPADGNYTFWINSDEESELWISTDENPVNKVLIVEVKGVLGLSDPSSEIHLEQGRRYYIEALHKENYWDDYLAVSWQVPDSTSSEIIGGSYLSPYNEPIDPSKSTVASSRPFVQANTIQTTTITVSLIGATYIPITGHEVELIHDGTNITVESTTTTTDANGQIQFTLRTGSPQTVSIQAHDKTSGVTLINNVQVVFTSYTVGSILHEWWDGIEGQSVADLTGNPKFLQSPTGNDLLPMFQGPTDMGDNYGARYRGLINPTVSGTYAFWIESDDDSELWLSTDEDPLNKNKILNMTGVTGLSSPAHRSLMAGKSYYIEALHKQSTGDDYLKVYWQIPGKPSGEVIDGSYIFPFVDNTTDPALSSVESSSVIVLADNSQKATITTKLVGDTSIPIIGHDVELIHNGTDVTIESSSTISDLSGQVQFTIRSGIPQTITLQARDKTDGITLNTELSVFFVSPSDSTILREWWTDISGTDSSYLYDISRYSYQPTGSEQLSSIEGPTDWQENYLSRYRGYIIAPVSGSYRFSIASNNSSLLYLSTDENPANKVLVTSGTSTTQNNWSVLSSNKELIAGKKYYIEALHKAGSGIEHLSVAWIIPGNSIELLSSPYISPYIPPEITPGDNKLSFEYWSGSSTIPQLLSNSNFPYYPSGTLPLSRFEAPYNISGSSRYRGYLTAPQDGDYTFWVSAKGGLSELWLSTDENPSNKVKIAYTTGTTNSTGYSWSGNASQKSAVMPLVDGQRYYIEAISGSTTSPYALAVAWQIPNGRIEIISGANLSSYPSPDPVPETGSILREYFLGISGGSVSDLTASPKYPNNPDGREELIKFEKPVNWGDNYGARFRGYILPPETGAYTFWISSDDLSELWLSPDYDPASKERIAYVPAISGGGNGLYQWNRSPLQQSRSINLVEGKKYYIEALHKEGGWDDHIEVGWMIPSTSTIAVIEGQYLSSYGVSNTSQPPDPYLSTVTVSPSIVASDNSQNATITVSLLDNLGNPVVGHEVEITHFGISVTISPLSSKTDHEGHIAFSIVSSQDQQLVLYARDKTSDVTLIDSPLVIFRNIDVDNSIVSVDPINVVADGQQTAVLSVTLKGLNGQPVADKPVNLRLLSGRQVFVNGTLASEDLISIGNTNIEGVATAQVSSTVSEQKLFDVFGDGALLTQKGQLTFIAGPVSLSQSRFLVEPLTVEADNEHFATVTIELKDAQSNPVVNHQIGLTVSGIEASITQPDPPVTDASGLFTATIKSMDVGKANINAQDITQTIVLGTAEVDFIAGIVDPVRSTIQASTQILKANGTDMALYVVTLMDSWDRPLSGHEVEVSVSGWDNIINGPAPQLTGADGKANFSLSSTRVETKTLTFRDKTVGITLRQMPVITFVDPSIDPSDDGACVQPVEGLVDWWPFDGNMSDVAGGRDGSPSFDIAYASGLVGQGLNFDGIDDSVGLGNWFDYQDFSISMWIKPDSIQTSDARILDNNFISSQNWSIQQNNNQTNHYLWSGDIGYLSSNKWQHLVISHDGSGVSKSYVDGVLTNTTQSGQINYNSSRFLHLGQAEAGGNNWNGLLDDLDVYNRALSQDEIKNIYFAGTAGKCKLTDSTESIVTATNTSVVANDVDTASVNVSLNDIYGGALAGHAVSLTISGSGNTIVSPSPVLTDQEGKASFTFTSTRAEDKTLTVKNETQGVVLKTKPIVNFVADTVSPDVSTVSADEAVTANNSSKATVVVTLLDINSNPVSNHEIELATTGTNVTLEAISAVTNEVGQAQFTARSGQLQTVTITARDKTAGIDLTSSANVEFVSTDGSTSVVTADPTSVIADGQQSISVLVTLKDFNGQPVIDKPVSLKITSGSQVFINGTAAATEAIALGNTNASGTATALVTSTKAEIKTIEIIGDRIKLDQVLTVSFAPGAVSTEKSRFTIDPLFLVGDGVQEAAITVELKDAFENPISNHQIGFVTSGINATITQTTPNTDADGKLTASIKSLELGKVLVSANDVTENVSLGNPIEVSFVNGLSDPDKSTVLVSPDSIAADGIAKATITVTLMDNQNRPLPDHEVELTSSGTTNTILGPVPLMTSGDGKATFTIASTESGIKTLTVRDKTINLTLNTAPKITFNPGPVSLNNITITAAPLEAPADGITPITLTATARDIYNNPVPGVPLTLRISGTTAVLGQTETVTDSLGQIKGIVKDTVIEKTMAGVLFNETAAAATVELSFRGPDIAVVLSGPERAAPGDSLTYTIFAQNKNMMAAEGVDISLQLPTDVTYVSQDSPVVPVIQGNTLKWTLGSLAGSTSVQFTVKVDVNNTVTVGTELKATAVVTSTMDDGNPTNNQVEVNTIVADALSVDASINPTFSSLPIGGETTFTIHILNTGLKVDTYNLSVEGLSPGWITLDRSLVNLLPGDSVDVLLKVAVRSCQFEEEIPFSVKVTSQQGEKTTTLNAKLMVVTAPQVWIDSPGDKSTLGSTSVLFAWRTNPASSGVLTIYPESHPELAQTYTSTESNNHSLKIENFARNTTYFWKLDSTTACGASQGAWRQFRVENGIVFSEIPTEYTIDRDYNQILRVLAKNEDVVVHSLKADLINPNEDLIANFVGSGSIDETINLGPGEIRELNLAVHAQDTVKTSYQLTAHLLTDGSTPKPIEDNATIKINILPSGDFSIDEDTSAYDPKFLAHTYIITNNGSTITDLSLKAIDPVTKLPARIFLKPSINHARLERGGTLKVVAYPIFDASDMEQDSSGGLQSQISDNRVFSRSQKGEIPAEITATGAGNTQTKPVTLNCQAKIFEVTHTDETLVCGSKDWYCTNRPNVTTNIGSPPNIKEANIKSASLSMIFTPWSNVLPHSGKIDFNKNQIGVFDSLVPNGAFSYDLDPQLINSVIAGPASQKVDLTTLHMNGGHYVSVSEYKLKIEVESYTSYVCAATQEEANTSKPPLCEYVASQLKDGIQIQNSLVESTGPKISNGGQGDNGDCPYSKYCGAQKAHADPINSKTGSLSLTVVDLSVPTSAGTLAFQRSYSSSATSIFTGVFGPGWTHNHDVRLIFPEDPTGLPGYVLFKGILGNEYFFKINEDGSYQPMPGVMATLTRTGQGETAQYAITSRMQTGFTFDATGKVLTRTDAQGNGFEYSYDGEGKLSRISADGGQRFIELNYDAQGRIVSAEDHANRQVTYNYNAEGDLNDLTDILGKNWSYLYDDAHRITRMSDPDGGSVTTEYDMQGRAYRQFDAKGNRVVLIVYNEDGSATVTGANGTESTDVYDPLNALSDSIDPLGGTTATERDAHYNPTSITDPGGDTTGLTWSEDGANLLEVTDAAGQTSSLTYDSYNNLTGVTDSAGHQTQYFYEDSSHPTLVTRIVDAQGTETSYEYDGNGRLIRTTDPLGHSTSYGYDSFGQRTSVTDALGHSTSSSYDDLGRMTDSTGIDGLTTHYEYDAAGHLTKSTRNYAPGRGQNEENLYNIVTTYEYDSVGNQTAVTDTLGATTRYEYDENNRLVKTIDPAGNETRSVYNAAGQLVESVDALGRSTSYSYDALGRVTITTAPDGSTTRSEYNPDGTVAASIDASGARTTYMYDELKRTTAIQDAMGNETHTSYDAAGNVQSSTDAMGNTTTYEYDALGRVVNTTSPDGSVTHTEYNSAGQTVSTTRNYDAGKGQNDGNVYNLVTSYTYDELGRQKTVTDTLGNSTTYNYDAAGRIHSVTDAMGRSTTYEYDSVGRQSAVIDPMGGRSSQSFDVLGRVTASTDMAGRTTSYDFDALGRQTAVVDAAGGRISYTYDAAGQRLSQTDANGNTTTFTYDSAGRTLTTTDANGKTVTNEYGSGGRLLSVTNGNGEKTRYEYDALGRQTAVTDPLGNVTRYTYNANGQRVMMTDANGIATQYGYDAAGRLTDVIENYVDGAPSDAETNVHTHYAYDLNGSRTSITDGNGNVTTFEYDALGRQTAESDALGHTTRYTYNADGNRATQVDAMGRTTSFEYNARGQLKRIVYPSPDPAVVFTYNDATGQRISMDDGIGRTTWNYDALGRVTSVTDPFGKTVAYEYDNVGNRTGLTYPDGKVVNYTYDPANRLQVVKDWLEQVTTYGYDSANRLNLVALPNGVNSNYTYDPAGHLTNLTHAAQDRTLASYTYTYDATGNRTSAVEDMVTLEGKPPYVSVFVKDTDGNAVVGAPVYAFTGTKYSGKTAGTDANGEARLTLPFGNYRFRVDIKDDALGTNTAQFWSTSDDACVVEGCHKVFVTVNKPVTVSVADSSGQPQSGLTVYAFLNTPKMDGSGFTETYSGISGKTGANGQSSLVLPFGQYRFRTDLNNTQFWSSPNTAGQMCDLNQTIAAALQDGAEDVRCTAASIQVSIPIKVTVASSDGDLISGTAVYAFTGTTYSGISAKTDANGEVTFTLPFGSYRFRADYKPEGAAAATQFWSGTDNHCTLPGCSGATVTVTKPFAVTVQDTDGQPMPNIAVYAFTGSTYKSYHGVTDAAGKVVFALPQGAYHFRADYNSTQFWSTTGDDCVIPGCPASAITVTKPLTVTVRDTDDAPMPDITVYAFDGTTYKGYSKKTSTAGQAVFTLPPGSYRFRADYNGTQFWSGAENHCTLPGCTGAGITLTKPVIVTALDTNNLPAAGISLYAFNSTTYKGYSGKTSAGGQVSFTLPLGSYRFRGDYNGKQYWSSAGNDCTLPGCSAASVKLGGVVPTVTPTVLAYIPTVVTDFIGGRRLAKPVDIRPRADSASSGPVVVTVQDTDGQPLAGMPVYAFTGATYTGKHGVTNASGQASIILPAGLYRFRSDRNGTKFWSSEADACAVPTCTAASVTVTKPVTVTVRDTDGQPQAGIPVYAFDGTTYKSISGKTDANGSISLTLPVGNYRFRGDLNGTKFWSSETNECVLPGCTSAAITLTKPVTVTVKDTAGAPREGLTVYAFDGATYKSINGKTDVNGNVTLTLPQGAYRFRADLNGTQFWSSEANECALPGCAAEDITVTIPMTVRVEGVDHSPFEGVKVYAFDGTTYKGYSGTSGKDGQVTFTLPQGNYRFRGDLNGTQFWSSPENACTLPGCTNAVITLPGGNTSRNSVTINYTYDGLSRLTAADYSSGDYYHYAYDAVGNRLTETTSKGETAYTYDPANRLTSVNGQAVQWDDNGNMLADGQAVYKYNTANKLVGVTKGTSSIVYAYSGLGDRLKQIADGAATDYMLDINAGLTQVLDDGTNKYLYGNQRIAQIALTQTGYFLPDALGSMRQMTDSSADLTLARAYDPYGNVVSSSGAGETVYGYTGEMQSGGLIHLRARDYASLLGRFTSRDTWEGDDSKPLSINKWLYVIGNPINRTDPSGMCLDEDLDGLCDHSERALLKILPQTDDPILACTPTLTPTIDPTILPISEQYKIEFVGTWPEDYKEYVISGATKVAEKLAEVLQTSPTQAFIDVYGLSSRNFLFELGECKSRPGIGGGCGDPSKGAYTWSSYEIEFAQAAPFYATGGYRDSELNLELNTHEVVHELGHAFAARFKADSPSNPYNIIQESKNKKVLDLGSRGYATPPLGAEDMWQINSSIEYYETFANMYIGWVYGKWAEDNYGTIRQDFMDNYMPNLVNLAAGR